jgi:hypothetical protein
MKKSTAGASGAIHDIFGKGLYMSRVVHLIAQFIIHKTAPAAADADDPVTFA